MQRTVLLEEKFSFSVRVTMVYMTLFSLYVAFNYTIFIHLKQQFCFSNIVSFYVVSGLEL